MIIIRNKFIPFPGFSMMNMWGIFLFVRGNRNITKRNMNHERIYSRQILEVTCLSLIPLSMFLFLGGNWIVGAILTVLSYYIWYVIEWLIRKAMGLNNHQAYRAVSFENEAYSNDTNFDYLKSRKLFSFLDYM